MTDPVRPNFSAVVARIAERAGDAVPEEEPNVVLVPRREALWHARRPGQIPKKFLTAKVADFRQETEETRSALNDWAVRPAGRNLVIGGPVGAGKSHCAVAACRRSHFTNDQDVHFWPVVELLDDLRPGGTEGTLSRLMAVDILILDDLGAERPTDWTSERLYALVNRRWLEDLPTVGTTNLPLTRKGTPDGYDGPTLDEVLGDRMFSRLIGGATKIRISGPDRRRMKP